MLFGVSFAVQLDSAARQGAQFRVRFARRLAALFVIGAAHAALWYGDVLKDYAVLGLALLAAARWPVRRVARTAILLLVARLAWPLLVWSAWSATGHSGRPAAPDQAFAEGVTGLSRGFGAFLRENLGLVAIKAEQMVYEGRFLAILAMFFIGAAIGKLGLYRDLANHRGRLVWAAIACGAVGAAAEVALLPYQHATNAYPPTLDWVVFQMLTAVAAPALSLAYASAFALAWLALKGRGLRALAPIGRTALTSYVAQTLVCTIAFVGFGLGRDLGALGCAIIAIPIVAVQAVLASAWLRRFRFGPLEWLWRRATYAAPVPLLRPGRA